MNKVKFALIIVIFSFTLFHCTNEEENPVPQILSVSPTSIVAHLPEFTMTINGQDFIEGSVIIFDGKEKPTSFINNTQLTCLISPEDTMIDIISSNMNADKVKNMEKPVTIVVKSPAPGGGNSTPVNFTIKENFEFESPRRLFPSIINGWIGPMVTDKDDDMYLNISDVEIDRYRIKIKNFLSTSDDGGDTWSTAENIVNRSDSNFNHLLVDDYGNIHFFYTDFRTNISGVFYKRKNKGEDKWSEPVNILGEDKSIFQAYLEESIAVRGDKIFVFWAANNKNYDYYIGFSFSEDNGKTWSEPHKLKDLGYIGWIQALLTENGTLHLVFGKADNNTRWEFYVDIHTARSTDNGKTWSDPIILSNGAGRSYYPQISYSGSGEEYKVFWIHKKTGSVFRNTPNKFSNRKSEIIGKMSEGPSPETDSPVQSTMITPPSFHLKMCGTGDDGNSWGNEMNIADFITTADIFNMHFFVKTDTAGNMNLVVNEEGSYYGVLATKNNLKADRSDAYFTRSIDGGNNWTSPVYLSDDPEFIAEYMNADSKGNVYILLNKYNFRKYFVVEPFFTRSIQ